MKKPKTSFRHEIYKSGWKESRSRYARLGISNRRCTTAAPQVRSIDLSLACAFPVFLLYLLMIWNQKRERYGSVSAYASSTGNEKFTFLGIYLLYWKSFFLSSRGVASKLSVQTDISTSVFFLCGWCGLCSGCQGWKRKREAKQIVHF